MEREMRPCLLDLAYCHGKRIDALDEVLPFAQVHGWYSYHIHPPSKAAVPLQRNNKIITKIITNKDPLIEAGFADLS